MPGWGAETDGDRPRRGEDESRNGRRIQRTVTSAVRLVDFAYFSDDAWNVQIGGLKFWCPLERLEFEPQDESTL